ncbi:MAG: hypothetical protein E6Q98_20510 [Rhodospirillaceae bacterium]|nr:MAG: hypothetical protein E6Q98_20510 [Rhodospirillaceae bacterium]
MTRRQIRPEDEDRRKQQPSPPTGTQKTTSSKNGPQGEDPGVENLKGGRAAAEEASKPKDD